MIDLLEQGFPAIAIIPESEAGKIGAAYSILRVNADLPDDQASLVCRKADHDAALIERLLSSWRS